ncbi:MULTISPECIES: hypothetical protein [Xanthomonas]|uniref:Uncharacterized protein n=1 Tax=Xanthomonas cucurbitae TaxID=56453 RepID=A0ABY7YIR5_9XANT|nr:hypothetical protein [Xanthomonas cucurbitae]WDM69908.1 hypothetical protein K6981_20485 [Xanthomonas cucurbitae]WDM73781.1 hypothetical protein K6978_20445 [Xanthomonas cucurbitae]WDM77485.1 hypothetical protein K6982_19585 [Xanthomonas cucurbitae]WDM81126.1 hypothetical protein K6980_19260 [Xanthomonas cucurbitae]WDM84801.1 hypothetical protein K6979_19260 [Xanthomonas cucurbitae]
MKILLPAVTYLDPGNAHAKTGNRGTAHKAYSTYLQLQSSGAKQVSTQRQSL